MKHALLFSIQHRNLIRNLGAHRIASFLREHGWDIEVIDFVGFWPREHLLELVKSRISSKTVFLGFSDPWGNAGLPLDVPDVLHEIMKLAKEKYPNIKTIVGGQKPASSLLDADYYIAGFGEYAMLETLKHILGTNTEKLKYTLYRNGKLVKGSDYPAIYMQDLFTRYEKRDFIHPGEQMGLEWSRGCKFNCDFCNFFPLSVKGDNFRDAQNYIDNIKYLNDEFGVSTFFSADSTGNVNPEKLALFGEETQKQLNFTPWICSFARVDLLISHPETWDSMIAMGFTGHHYGLDTLNHQTGKVIKKGMHPDKVKQGLKDIHNYFSKRSTYIPRISMIAGLPYETYETFLEGAVWIFETFPDASSFSYPLWIPHPNHYDPENRSLISLDYEKYGYIDLRKDTGEHHGNYELDWYNTVTKTSYDGFIEILLTHPALVARKLVTSPWLLGEMQILTGLPFEEVVKIRWTDRREYDPLTCRAIEFYDDQGAYNYVKNYIKNKLNWQPE